jgi:hypothetical protein
MEELVLSILFIVITAFCYSLWKTAIKEEKKEIKDLFL